eukprot:1168173-Prorocentrum_minimum.AAC.2
MVVLTRLRGGRCQVAKAEWQMGYNAMSDTFEDLLAAGVIDPKKVRAPVPAKSRSTLPVSDWSGTRVYLRFLCLIGPAREYTYASCV